MGATAQACFQYRHRDLQRLRRRMKVIACIEDPIVIKRIPDHLKHKAETSGTRALPKAGRHRLSCSWVCLTDEPEGQRYQSKCCVHSAAAGIRRAGCRKRSR